ncbi:MAG: carboxypeptidase regulatory-like domain-containing protein [Polyangiaceae bacterium]
MKRSSRRPFAVAGLLAVVALLAGLAAPACGSPFPPLFTQNGGEDAGVVSDARVPILTPGCTGFECSVVTCADGGSTTVSGTVYDPAGNDPLYNVVVYVPSSTPGPLPTGASCNSCDSLYLGGPVAAAVTDATGKFTIQNVPSGTSIPLVIQIGKWRRQTTVASVIACTDNPITTKLTLPSSQSEGDLPNIAISTGGADSLECLLRRIGVDASEYEPGAAGPGRIHIFQGSSSLVVDGIPAATTSPPAPYSSESLWNSLANLMPYDITILSCEGAETIDQPLGGPLKVSDQENLLAYTSAGGRVFASHFHYAWFDTGPFGAENIATWTRGANPITEASNNPVSTSYGDFIYANILTTLDDGGPFPKGQVLDQWLGTVNALNSPAATQAPGELVITGAKHNADLAGVAGTPSQGWIAADKNAVTEVTIPPALDAGPVASVAGATEYLSFNTPVDAGLDDAGQPAYCGRVVYSDLHVGAASGDYGGQGAGGIVPSGCADNPLSPQERALEFMLFDLSSCVTPDNGAAQQPIPGPIK